MVENDYKPSEIIGSGPEWLEMVANGHECLQTVADGHKRSQVL